LTVWRGLAKRHGIRLRQSYARVGKCAPKQFKRARRALKTLKTYLGRVIRDITRKIAGNESPREVFAKEADAGPPRPC
jgi:transposase, IS5 family